VIHCVHFLHGGMETKLVPPLLFGRVLPADPLLLYSSSAARPRVKARAPKLHVRWRRTGARERERSTAGYEQAPTSNNNSTPALALFYVIFFLLLTNQSKLFKGHSTFPCYVVLAHCVNENILYHANAFLPFNCNRAKGFLAWMRVKLTGRKK
jgi:hypothetical protein